MILPSDDKSATIQPPMQVIQMPLNDLPPTYTSTATPTSPTQPTSSKLSPTPGTPQLPVKPSNYISISSRDASVKGTWVIDPSLKIPTSLLAPLLEGQTESDRRNLNVESKNGHVNADIFITPFDFSSDSKEVGRKRTTIYVKSSDGSVTAKLHDCQSPRLPFYLNAYSSDGHVTVHIPRSFHGLIVIASHHGHCKFSEEITKQLTVFSDVGKTRKAFLGDFSGLRDDEAWEGDEIMLESKDGSVWVHFDDEHKDQAKNNKSFFGKMFGF